MGVAAVEAPVEVEVGTRGEATVGMIDMSVARTLRPEEAIVVVTEADPEGMRHIEKLDQKRTEADQAAP